MSRFRSLVRAFIVALLATIVMVLVRRFVFIPLFEFKPPAMPAILAIMLAAWLGGLSSGAFTTLLNAGLLTFSDGEAGFHLATMSSQLRLSMFVVIGGLISWGIGALHVARQRLEDRQRELEREVIERRKAEEVIRASESRLQAIMDNTLAVIYLKDLQGRFLMINKRFEELLNVTQRQFVGKTDADIFPSDVVETIQAHDRQVSETGKSLEFEEVVPHKDGPHTYVAVKFPVFDAAGKCTAVGGISTDITDRKAIEDVVRASEIRLRGILDNIPAVISLIDLQGRYELVNRGWEELFGVRNDQIVGLTNEELLSKTLSVHMSKEIADQFFKIDQKVIRTGEPIEFEDPMPYGDDPRVFATVKFPIKDAGGRITGVGGISIDVTERRKAIDSLAGEQELLRHTIEFQDHERQLISYEIHDGLIQYVTGALMQLESLRCNNSFPPTTEAIESIEGILRRAVAEGRHLMNGIRTPVLDNFGVVAAVEHLIEEEERAHVQVEFIKDDGLERMEPKTEEAIFRITQEALTNVSKHSQSKNVRVELGRCGGRVHLEVQDWGVGFTPSNRRKDVNGLRGMTERARIAGGTCKIESTPGKGTRVVVDLPYLIKN